MNMTEVEIMKQKADELGQMQNMVLDLLTKLLRNYKDYSEVSTIKMGLSNAFKEINSIRLKIITGDEPENPKTNGTGNRN